MYASLFPAPGVCRDRFPRVHLRMVSSALRLKSLLLPVASGDNLRTQVLTTCSGALVGQPHRGNGRNFNMKINAIEQRATDANSFYSSTSMLCSESGCWPHAA